jgi:short-subunit dehydrogenase
MATQAFAVNGAKVYIIGRTKEKLDKVAEIYGKDIPGQIIPLQGDISKKESIAAMVKEIESKEKCVCILVNKSVHMYPLAIDRMLTSTAPVSHPTPCRLRPSRPKR